jgi:DNA-dependent RNA polymerase auxiliary subunit epsilon
MRILFEIPGDHVKTTVFHWNQKYLIKLEMAMYEQTYKVSEFDVSGDEDIRKLIEDETFKVQYMERFKQMHVELHETLERI